MVNVILAQEARRLVAIIHAELAAGAIAVGVHRGLGELQLAGDLLGAEVLVDQAQAVTLTLREQLDRTGHGVRT
jgi:hypothetical protein